MRCCWRNPPPSGHRCKGRPLTPAHDDRVYDTATAPPEPEPGADQTGYSCFMVNGNARAAFVGGVFALLVVPAGECSTRSRRSLARSECRTRFRKFGGIREPAGGVIGGAAGRPTQAAASLDWDITQTKLRSPGLNATIGGYRLLSFPAPGLCQYADEEIMLEIGNVVFSGCLKRWPGENGLRIWVDGNPQASSASRGEALARFQTVLGILRAWRPDAGELQDERRVSLGEGTVRDEHGNQYVSLGTIVTYSMHAREIETFAIQSMHGINATVNLSNALWLHGRANRNAADFYMIHEYAQLEFGSPKGIMRALGISVGSQSRLTKSANNLSPLAGGRHVSGDADAVVMSLKEQREHVARLLRSWIATYA
jgi:hypothetical protein